MLRWLSDWLDYLSDMWKLGALLLIAAAGAAVAGFVCFGFLVMGLTDLLGKPEAWNTFFGISALFWFPPMFAAAFRAMGRLPELSERPGRFADWQFRNSRR